jgi:hypothetical protein
LTWIFALLPSVSWRGGKEQIPAFMHLDLPVARRPTTATAIRAINSLIESALTAVPLVLNPSFKENEPLVR